MLQAVKGFHAGHIVRDKERPPLRQRKVFALADSAGKVFTVI
jgi:hypothetical protein